MLIKNDFIIFDFQNCTRKYQSNSFPFLSFYHSTIVIFASFFILFILVDRVFAENEFYSIENTLKYQDESGYLYVLGEISNVSEESLTNVTLTADFYDIDGKLLGEYYRSPEIGVINPAERSPFKIIYLEQPTADKVFNYTIRVDYEVGNIKPDELVIESLNSRFDISGFYYINGQITNNGIENANNVTVVGTFYDKNGNVIGITEAITEPFSIPSKDSSAFGLTLTSKSQVSKVKDFSIKAYSDEYLSKTISTKKVG